MCLQSFVQSEASLGGTWSAAEARSHRVAVRRARAPVCMVTWAPVTWCLWAAAPGSIFTFIGLIRREYERGIVCTEPNLTGAAAAREEEEEEEEEDGQTGGGRGDRWAETQERDFCITIISSSQYWINCISIINIVTIIWPNITSMNASLLIKTLLWFCWLKESCVSVTNYLAYLIFFYPSVPLFCNCTHTHTHTHTHIYIHTYTHTHIYIHTYIHTHTHIYTYTHTHIYILGLCDMDKKYISRFFDFFFDFDFNHDFYTNRHALSYTSCFCTSYLFFAHLACFCTSYLSCTSCFALFLILLHILLFISFFFTYIYIYALVWCYFYIICILCTVHWADLIWSTFHFWLYPV